MFELRFTKCVIFLEASVNPFKTSLDASLSQIMGNVVFFLFFGLSESMAIKSLLLNDILGVSQLASKISLIRPEMAVFLTKCSKKREGAFHN